MPGSVLTFATGTAKGARRPPNGTGRSTWTTRWSWTCGTGSSGRGPGPRSRSNFPGTRSSRAGLGPGARVTSGDRGPRSAGDGGHRAASLSLPGPYRVRGRLRAGRAGYDSGALHVWFLAKNPLQFARCGQLHVAPRRRGRGVHVTVAPTGEQLATVAAGGGVYWLDGEQVAAGVPARKPAARHVAGQDRWCSGPRAGPLAMPRAAAGCPRPRARPARGGAARPCGVAPTAQSAFGGGSSSAALALSNLDTGRSQRLGSFRWSESWES